MPAIAQLARVIDGQMLGEGQQRVNREPHAD
jgi:hypothetical protein